MFIPSTSSSDSLSYSVCFYFLLILPLFCPQAGVLPVFAGRLSPLFQPSSLRWLGIRLHFKVRLLTRAVLLL